MAVAAALAAALPAAASPRADAAPAIDPYAALALYLGDWVATAVGRDAGATSTIAITDAISSLALDSSEGWTGNIIWGVGGDMRSATGPGFWTGGDRVGQPFTLEVTVSPDDRLLTVELYLPDGASPRSITYERAAGQR